MIASSSLSLNSSSICRGHGRVFVGRSRYICKDTGAESDGASSMAIELLSHIHGSALFANQSSYITRSRILHAVTFESLCTRTLFFQHRVEMTFSAFFHLTCAPSRYLQHHGITQEKTDRDIDVHEPCSSDSKRAGCRFIRMAFARYFEETFIVEEVRNGSRRGPERFTVYGDSSSFPSR